MEITSGNSQGKESTLDLDKVLEEFNTWYTSHQELLHQDETLEGEVLLLQKQNEMNKEKLLAAQEDYKQTQAMVSKLQSMLKLKCDVEDENTQLKDKVTNLIDEQAAVREEHKHTLRLAEDEMKELKSSHEKEIQELQESANAQRLKEVGLVKSSLQNKMAEISLLHQQLLDLEKEKQTEITRLRLEYDTKLLKLQREMNRTQQQNSKSASKGSDIFRQKLLNVRCEADREILSLKRTISDLQRKLDAQTGSCYGPKRKY